jgi:hypothetical protein
MSDSHTAVPVENPLLDRWQAHAKRLKRMHGAATAFFKRRADAALFTTVFLSFGVGCLNLTFGIGCPEAATGVPAIVSDCLLLLSGSRTALNNGPNKAERHDDFESKYGGVVRDINTECTLGHMHDDAVYASEAEFIRHMSTVMNRLDESAPSITGSIEKSNGTPKI